MAEGVDALVEERIRRWRERQAAAQGVAKAAPRPLVTLSREFGSEGAEIGRRAAKKLGFGFWDKEIVNAVAERSGATERMIEALDERARSDLEDFIAASVTDVRHTRSHYVGQLRRVVLTLAQAGGAVIVGRGAQYFAPPDRTLRVRVVAPLDDRVESCARRHGLTPDAAKKKIAQVEKERRAFIRQTFDADVADPLEYDLLLNRPRFTLDEAADVVVGAYRARFGAA